MEALANGDMHTVTVKLTECSECDVFDVLRMLLSINVMHSKKKN